MKQLGHSGLRRSRSAHCPGEPLPPPGAARHLSALSAKLELLEIEPFDLDQIPTPLAPRGAITFFDRFSCNDFSNSSVSAIMLILAV